MKYAVEMGSAGMIYIPSFIKTGSGIQKLMERTGADSRKHRQRGDRISLLLFFQNKESRLKFRSFYSVQLRYAGKGEFGDVTL
jgi:hypothetical protein